LVSKDIPIGSNSKKSLLQDVAKIIRAKTGINLLIIYFFMIFIF